MPSINVASSVNGRRTQVGADTVLVVDGHVAQGPAHLLGRSLDDLVPAGHIPPLPHDRFTCLEDQGEHTVQVQHGPYYGGPFRFQDRETAVLTQHYLAQGGHQYAWVETPEHIEIHKETEKPGGGLWDDEDWGEKPQDYQGREHPRFALIHAQEVRAQALGTRPADKNRQRRYQLHASIPKTRAGRKAAEKGWRALLKGEMYHHLVGLRYYPALAPFDPGLARPLSTGVPGSTGIGPLPGAQGGAGGSSPTGGSSGAIPN